MEIGMVLMGCAIISLIMLNIFSHKNTKDLESRVDALEHLLNKLLEDERKTF